MTGKIRRLATSQSERRKKDDATEQKRRQEVRLTKSSGR